MITKKDLEKAIIQCESAPTSYQNCEKLATFYTILDHMKKPQEIKAQETIMEQGESDFLQAVQGLPVDEMLSIMDELMDATLIANPRLYQGVMRKIKGQA